jgi:hypothetical protein
MLSGDIGRWGVCVFGGERSIDAVAPSWTYGGESRAQLQLKVKGGDVEVEGLVMLGGFVEFVWMDARSDYLRLLQLHCASWRNVCQVELLYKKNKRKHSVDSRGHIPDFNMSSLFNRT